MSFLSDVLIRMKEIRRTGEIGVRRRADGQVVCFYCGQILTEGDHGDHLTPKVLGGLDKVNIVRSCVSCNSSKGSKHPLAWVAEQKFPEDMDVEVLARLLAGMGESLAQLTPVTVYTADGTPVDVKLPLNSYRTFRRAEKYDAIESYRLCAMLEAIIEKYELARTDTDVRGYRLGEQR